MGKGSRGLVRFCALWGFACMSSLAILEAHPFLKNDRISFYGDSNTDWGTYHKLIQDYFHQFDRSSNLQVFNEGI